MGAIYDGLGNYKEAKRFYNLSIHLYEGVAGPHHLNLADSCYNLGLAHNKLQELTDAEDCFRRALAIYIRHLESCNIRIVRVSLSLAEVLEKKGHLDKEAKLYINKVLYCE